MKLPWRRTKVPKTVVRFDELIESASTAALPGLLRSLSMLARDLQDAELQQWADLELNGYWKENPAMTEAVVVPEYRGAPGQWKDEYGRPLILQDPALHYINETRLRQGVEELERLSHLSKILTIQDAYGASIIREHMQVEVTWFQFSSTSIIGILTAIRSRLVDRLYQLRPVIDQIRSKGQRRPDLTRLAQSGYLADPTALRDHIERIEKSIDDDPAQAIGSAKELVETAAKHVLLHYAEDPEAIDKFPRLVKTAVAKLNLASQDVPDAHKGAQAVAMLTGGLGQIGEAAATLRNLYGTGHGRTHASGADTRLARLVVGACATLATFLLETLAARKAAG